MYTSSWVLNFCLIFPMFIDEPFFYLTFLTFMVNVNMSKHENYIRITKGHYKSNCFIIDFIYSLSKYKTTKSVTHNYEFPIELIHIHVYMYLLINSFKTSFLRESWVLAPAQFFLIKRCTFFKSVVNQMFSLYCLCNYIYWIKIKFVKNGDYIFAFFLYYTLLIGSSRKKSMFDQICLTGIVCILSCFHLFFLQTSNALFLFFKFIYIKEINAWSCQVNVKWFLLI